MKGEDYDETLTLVAKISIVCMLLEVVVAKDCEVHQMDVYNAFFMVST